MNKTSCVVAAIRLKPINSYMQRASTMNTSAWSSTIRENQLNRMIKWAPVFTDSILPSLLLLLPAATITGCGTAALPPQVAISYRPSVVGQGQVVVITNKANHHPYNVKVVGRSFKEVSSASVKASDHLSPQSSLEVGGLEFENWTPRPGGIY
jgi:hypothetical protein